MTEEELLVWLRKTIREEIRSAMQEYLHPPQAAQAAAFVSIHEPGKVPQNKGLKQLIK